MNVHPFEEVIANANRLIQKGATCFEQWNCCDCGTKNTIDIPNVFYTKGRCETCGAITDLQATGINMMVMLALQPPGESPDDPTTQHDGKPSDTE